jgi:hypothetical protein
MASRASTTSLSADGRIPATIRANACSGHRGAGQSVAEPQGPGIIAVSRLQIEGDEQFGPPVGELVDNFRGVIDVRPERLEDAAVARGERVREALEEPGEPGRSRAQVGVQRHVAAEILLQRPSERRLLLGPLEGQPEPHPRLRRGQHLRAERLALARVGTIRVADLHARDAPVMASSPAVKTSGVSSRHRSSTYRSIRSVSPPKPRISPAVRIAGVMRLTTAARSSGTVAHAWISTPMSAVAMPPVAGSWEPWSTSMTFASTNRTIMVGHSGSTVPQCSQRWPSSSPANRLVRATT